MRLLPQSRAACLPSRASLPPLARNHLAIAAHYRYGEPYARLAVILNEARGGDIARLIVQETGVMEIHLRGGTAEESAMRFRRPGVFMGKAYQPDEYRRSETGEGRIREVVAAVG